MRFAELTLYSERVVDTSSLRSTKTIGQAKKAKSEKSRNGQWDTLSSEEEDAAVGVIDDISVNLTSSSILDGHAQQALSEDINKPMVGSALKGGKGQEDGKASNVVRRAKSSRLSWRERLGDKRNLLGVEKSEDPESEMSLESESESELSEWSGFSDRDELEPDVGTSDHTQNSGAAAVPLTAPTEEIDFISESSGDNSSEDEDAGDRQTRAKEFKEWAREQSGLGSSVSNISSLPQLPPDLKNQKALTADIYTTDLAKVQKSIPVHSSQFRINRSPSLFPLKGGHRYRSQDFRCRSSPKNNK